MRGEARGRPVLAMDLGGTTTRVALVGPGGRLLARTSHPTAAEAEPEAALAAMAVAGDALLASARLMSADLRGVGMAVPGPMDFRRGVVLTSPNLPRWRDVPLRAMLEARWPVPAFAENDANAAALGERSYGAGRDFTDFIYLTISTGIGGGLVLGGRLYRG
ncbi:MAG: ROK family protein, partial [Chloroflexi bacterium]|nr:ROK family protein [Chloroflexota bacterium]